MTTTLSDDIIAHYEIRWANRPVVKRWDKGPFWELPASFGVLEFAPTESRRMWTYATFGMAQPLDNEPLEIHLFSPIQSDMHVELLTAIAHYHRGEQPLGLGHTVNFGRPWIAGSECEYGLISLPYLDGPPLEQFHSDKSEHIIRCLWLVPITKAERDFKIAFGIEALERKFEEARFDYVDALRKSVV